ncbi:UNVERIFIED_ORG: hypothetical protein ABIC43_001607 [Variovorax guangxiensis]
MLNNDTLLCPCSYEELRQTMRTGATGKGLTLMRDAQLGGG